MLRWTVLLLAACSDRGAPVAAEMAAAPAPVAPDAGLAREPRIAAPHGAEIALVAVTDDARAAITADDTGDLRFWPSLDGKQEPVVLRGHAPSDLVLARERDGFVAALLDAASGIELLHVAKDGALRGRQLIAAEPGYVELVAAETTILARRTDQTIVRLDGNAPRVLAPAAGELIVGLAARGDDAVAGIADPEHPSEVRKVRAFALAHGLAWGTTYELPLPLVVPFALSPSGRRIAGIDARTSLGIVIELGAQPRVIASDVIAEAADKTIGFLDEDRVVFRGGVVVGLPQITVAGDPWSGTHASLRLRLGRGVAIADDFVVSGLGTHLMLGNSTQTLFLGYRELGVGFLRVIGSQITLVSGTRVLWLDDRLRERRSRDVLADMIGGLAVDDTHLLKATYSYLAEDRSQLDLSLFDVGSGAYAGLGMYPQASNVGYEPATRVYAVWGQTREVARAHLDVAARTSAPLRALRTRDDMTVELLDPAVANGMVAVAYTLDDAGTVHVDTFVDDHKSNRPIAPSSTVKIHLAIDPLGVDRAGAMYTLAGTPDETGKLVFVHVGGKEVKKLVVDEAATSGTVARDGTFATYTRTGLVLYEADGKVRWRVPAWAVNNAMFTTDGKTLLVNTQGGLLALDTSTGARVATGCGWGFGLSTTEPQLSIFIAPIVCAEASPP